jgi:cellulose biosynthesis protein BcsQ
VKLNPIKPSTNQLQMQGDKVLDKRIMVICDLEENYAHRMMEVLKLKKEIPFEIHVFTKIDSLVIFWQKKKVECLLITESAYCEEVKASGIPHVFILNESGLAIEENHYVNINKYQSIDLIISEILTSYSEHSPLEPTKKLKTLSKNAKIIGVYTPIGRCLQTTFAVTLGQMLARNHRTLYLNYECFSGFSQLMGREFKSDLTDLMYFFECVREKFVFKLNTITEQVNGMDFIPPAAVYPDLMNIPGKHWTDLLREMKVECDYQYILLDLTDYVNGLVEILQECDRIYTITKGDAMAVAKMEQYEKALREMNCAEVAMRTRKIKLPIFKNVPIKFSELTYGEVGAYIKENIWDDIQL